MPFVTFGCPLRRVGGCRFVWVGVVSYPRASACTGRATRTGGSDGFEQGGGRTRGRAGSALCRSSGRDVGPGHAGGGLEEGRRDETTHLRRRVVGACGDGAEDGPGGQACGVKLQPGVRVCEHGSVGCETGQGPRPGGESLDEVHARTEVLRGIGPRWTTRRSDHSAGP